MWRLLRLTIAAAIGPAFLLLIGARADSALADGSLLLIALAGLAIWSIAEASAAYNDSVNRWNRVEHSDREVWVEWRRRLLVVAIPASLALILFLALNRDPTSIAVVAGGCLLGVIYGWRITPRSREGYLARMRSTRYNAAAAGLGLLIFAIASELGARTLIAAFSFGLVTGAFGLMLGRHVLNLEAGSQGHVGPGKEGTLE